MKFMQRKRIKITTEARAELLKLKQDGENFSDVILRHFPRRAKNVIALRVQIVKDFKTGRSK
jgi:predicted CopG family antitoxin